MGVLVDLGARRSQPVPRARRRSPDVVFAFDLASPFTYLAAERAYLSLPGARWSPVPADALHREQVPATAELRAAAEARARELHLPLVWPERPPVAPLAAMRIASLASEVGRAAPFVLAAGRLAFCGGFDLDDPETLAEASAAAGLPLDACLAAAGDVSRDGRLEREARSLLRRGADALPLVAVGGALFCGEHRLSQAAVAARAARVTAR